MTDVILEKLINYFASLAIISNHHSLDLGKKMAFFLKKLYSYSKNESLLSMEFIIKDLYAESNAIINS